MTKEQIKQVEELTGLKYLPENSPYRVYIRGYEFQYDHSRKAMEKNNIIFGTNDYGLIINSDVMIENNIRVFRAPAPQRKDKSAQEQAEDCWTFALAFPIAWLRKLADILEGGE